MIRYQPVSKVTAWFRRQIDVTFTKFIFETREYAVDTELGFRLAIMAATNSLLDPGGTLLSCRLTCNASSLNARVLEGPHNKRTLTGICW